MNKGAIRTHFKALLNRSDITDTLADTFLDQSIARAERTLRIPSMEKTATYTIAASTSFLTIPSDFLEIIDIYHGSTNLTKVPMSKMVEMSDPAETGTPKHFAREGSTWKIYPYPTTGSLTVNYYASFVDMTSDTDENDLALIASDLIVYGALAYASDYYLDDRGQLFEAKFGQFMSELQEQSNDAEMSGTVQQMQFIATYAD